MKLEIFEPAMCCPTGVCGVEVDQTLVRFNADLQWVKSKGVEVGRHNLAQDPQAFAADAAVLAQMQAGMDRLPVVLVDGKLVSTGHYPSRAQLAEALALGPVTTDKLRIPIAAAGCKPGSGCC